VLEPDHRAWLTRAINGAGFGFVAIGPELNVLAANDAACALLGAPEHRLIGRGFAELVHSDDRGWIDGELQWLFAGVVGSIRKDLRLAWDAGRTPVEAAIRLTETSAAGAPCALAMLGEGAAGRESERELRREGEIDSLTGLPNACRFESELDQVELDPSAPPLRLVASPGNPGEEVTLRRLLATVAELGGATTGLVAWELAVDSQAVSIPWALATGGGLLERGAYDSTAQDWLYRLTPAGTRTLEALESTPVR
jgi:PAS domain S-box-containing protein